MHKRNITFIATGILFLLFLCSYKFSLYHTSSMLPYLATPQTVAPIPYILTFVMMMAGVLPTILLILYTTFLCHTTLVNWAIRIVCFGSSFTLADSGGFFAYIIASLISAVAAGYFLSLALSKK
jgi:hypothetical protein